MGVGLLTACGPSVTLPNVVGMRLDDAHRAMEKIEVENFDDDDAIEDRTIFLDSNWVVLEQSPAAGTKAVDTGTTVKLSVGNEDDEEVLQMLPDDAPFVVELAKQAADDKAEQDAAYAEQAKEDADQAVEDAKNVGQNAPAAAKQLDAYMDLIDTSARSFKGVLKLYDQNVEQTLRNGYGSIIATERVGGAGVLRYERRDDGQNDAA
jgi:beta-lactam-binding protein with PASTA domain